MNSKNPVGWFEIYVDDMNRAKNFYGNVFERGDFFKLSDGTVEMFAFPPGKSNENASGALVKTPFMKPGKGGTVVYFSCDDCAFEESKVVPNGGNVLKTKFSIGTYGFVSIVEDTEGNLIGLHSLK